MTMLKMTKAITFENANGEVISKDEYQDIMKRARKMKPIDMQAAFDNADIEKVSDAASVKTVWTDSNGDKGTPFLVADGRAFSRKHLTDAEKVQLGIVNFNERVLDDWKQKDVTYLNADGDEYTESERVPRRGILSKTFNQMDILIRAMENKDIVYSEEQGKKMLGMFVQRLQRYENAVLNIKLAKAKKEWKPLKV